MHYYFSKQDNSHGDTYWRCQDKSLVCSLGLYVRAFDQNLIYASALTKNQKLMIWFTSHHALIQDLIRYVCLCVFVNHRFVGVCMWSRVEICFCYVFLCFFPSSSSITIIVVGFVWNCSWSRVFEPQCTKFRVLG